MRKFLGAVALLALCGCNSTPPQTPVDAAIVPPPPGPSGPPSRIAHQGSRLGVVFVPVSPGSATALKIEVNWFVALFKELGYEGCSSHSGRRSFITGAARNIHRSGCSLRDVQLLAGHASIETTERYVDGDTCAQRRLIAYI